MILTITLDREEQELINEFHNLMIEISNQFANEDVCLHNDTYAQLETITRILNEEIVI